MFLVILIPRTLFPCMIYHFAVAVHLLPWTIIWNLCQKYFSPGWIFTCFYYKAWHYQFNWVLNPAHSLRSSGPPWWGKSKLLIYRRASYFHSISESFFPPLYDPCFCQWQGKIMFGCQRSGLLVFYHYLKNMH